MILGHREVNAGDVLRQAGLSEIERRLSTGEMPQQPDEGYVEILYSSEESDELVALDGSAKQCAWQVRTERGVECDATPIGEERVTTQATCRGCALPDARVICAQLRHPTNLPIRTFGGFERLAGPALCEIGNDAGDGRECRPGGKECWQRTVEPTRQDESDAVPSTAAVTQRDLLREVAAEIDHFSAAYRRRYHASVWNIDQARTIVELGGTPTSEESFQRKVQVLGVLLDGLLPHDQLDEAQRVDTAGNRVGGLVALERLLGRDAPEGVEAAQVLRHIRTLRNDFPAHARARGFDQAVAALGFSYPPDDWGATWELLLGRFRDSLREIRAALAGG